RIAAARDELEKYKACMNQALVALKEGRLEDAKVAAAIASGLHPEDANVKLLTSRIDSELQERALREEAFRKAKQTAMAVNAVEKAISDVKLYLTLGDTNPGDVSEIFERVRQDALLVPSALRFQLESLRRQIEGKQQLNRKPELRQAVGFGTVQYSDTEFKESRILGDSTRFE